MTGLLGTGTRLGRARWLLAVGVLLLAWGLRLCCLEDVPPGWRDDELIEIHVLVSEVLTGHFPIYFEGASGHEPLYHYLHAGLHAMLGYNVLSGHLLSVAFGMLNVALTYALARRVLKSEAVAWLAAVWMGVSFWALMYSRFGLRHISAVTFALLGLYWLWRALDQATPQLRDGVVPGLALGVGLYTYFASRLLPLLLVAYGLYLLMVHRAIFRRTWRMLVLALGIAALTAVPLVWAIGGVTDARITELAGPLRQLVAGNARPLWDGLWQTLGMFHATGDPEWLYNVAGRPLFNVAGAVVMWAGVALCLWRWRQPHCALLLLWFALGLAPAFASIPPASLSHTIVAQPAVAMLGALATVEVTTRMGRWARSVPSRGTAAGARRAVSLICMLALITVWASNVARDLRGYFVVWPRQDLVRYLYRADYRQASDYLAAHRGITDIAVGSALFGQWDRVALEVDSRRSDLRVRFFNPQRALVWVSGGSPQIMLTFYPRPEPPISDWLAGPTGPQEGVAQLEMHTLSPPSDLGPPLADLAQRTSEPLARFDNGLNLVGAAWLDATELRPGGDGRLVTLWQVAEALTLPVTPLVAYPPPPGVYDGPRLAVFAHLVDASGSRAATDDGLWVDAATLQPGDLFAQVHRFAPEADAPAGPYTVEIGLYDPLTGERWLVGGVVDKVSAP